MYLHIYKHKSIYRYTENQLQLKCKLYKDINNTNPRVTEESLIYFEFRMKLQSTTQHYTYCMNYDNGHATRCIMRL